MTSGRSVVVTAPSRLHFGMFGFGQPSVRQFGGVGVMLAAPVLRLKVTPQANFEPAGADAARIAGVVERLARAGWCGPSPACRMEAVETPPSHVGLGSGTQLAMAVAAGINAFLGRPRCTAEELARACGRGVRSAIGLYGFARGGLLVEAGKRPGQRISPLVAHATLPAQWRFVLLLPRGQQGPAGDAERLAFETLPPVPLEVTERLCRLALLDLLPAGVEGHFREFSNALYEFNRLAGSCFSAVQGGLYADGLRRQLVDWLRWQGVKGVAQSSWGPGLMALAADQDTALRLVEQIGQRDDAMALDVMISPPASQGATLEVDGAMQEAAV